MDPVTSSRKRTRDLRDFACFKDFMSTLVEGLNDAQIRRLKQEMFTLAELLLDHYLKKEKQKRR